MAIACTSNKPLENPILGEVFDASINNISIITPNKDTLNISSTELSGANKKIGVFLGDSISIVYVLFEGEQIRNNYFNATLMTFVYRQPCYHLVGEWVEPNPIDASKSQGFVFNADGSASAIGMATLECRKWSLDTDKLTLTMTSKEVKNPSTSDVTYRIKNLDNTSRVLCEGDNVIFNLTPPPNDN